MGIIYNRGIGPRQSCRGKTSHCRGSLSKVKCPKGSKRILFLGRRGRDCHSWLESGMCRAGLSTELCQCPSVLTCCLLFSSRPGLHHIALPMPLNPDLQVPYFPALGALEFLSPALLFHARAPHTPLCGCTSVLTWSPPCSPSPGVILSRSSDWQNCVPVIS